VRPGLDPAEGFVALQQAVQWTELAQGICRERPARMLAHEPPEPFAQGARLIRDLVQLVRRGTCCQRVQIIRRHQLRLCQPVDQAIAVVDPVHGRIDRRRHRVEEVEAERVGDEHGRRAVHERSLAGRDKMDVDNQLKRS